MKKCVFCFLLILAACGGGSDDVFVPAGGDDDVTILPTYGYQISASPAAGALTVMVPGEGGMRAVSMDFGNTLNGEVNVSVDSNNKCVGHRLFTSVAVRACR